MMNNKLSMGLNSGILHRVNRAGGKRPGRLGKTKEWECSYPKRFLQGGKRVIPKGGLYGGVLGLGISEMGSRGKRRRGGGKRELTLGYR